MRQHRQTQVKHKESDPADDAIEVICVKGCKAVWQDIKELEERGPLTQQLGLNDEQRRRVLAELKAIMATYSYRCTPE